MATCDMYGEDLVHPVIVRSSIPGKPQVLDWIFFLEDDELEGRYDFEIFCETEIPMRYRFTFSDLMTATMFRMRF